MSFKKWADADPFLGQAAMRAGSHQAKSFEQKDAKIAKKKEMEGPKR
jgi:hypothetical protein